MFYCLLMGKGFKIRKKKRILHMNVHLEAVRLRLSACHTVFVGDVGTFECRLMTYCTSERVIVFCRWKCVHVKAV
jgi:hypothetical protein